MAAGVFPAAAAAAVVVVAGSYVRCIALLTALPAAACSSGEAEVAADRVFLNGAIYTVDAERSWAEAVAIRDGEIVYVGNADGLDAHVGPATEQTDLEGRMLLPGFHDSHVHILIGVMAEEDCSLENLETVAEIETRLQECTSLDSSPMLVLRHTRCPFGSCSRHWCASVCTSMCLPSRNGL